ncbi:MAG: glycosyltransferase, partial [Geminicoccaceae bacterium]
MTARPLAFFIPFSFGRGPERVNVTLARVLAECGLDIDVVAGSSAGPYFNELDGKARVIDLSVGNTLAGLPALMRYLKSER